MDYEKKKKKKHIKGRELVFVGVLLVPNRGSQVIIELNSKIFKIANGL
jgi:hypothetical protein